MCQPYGQRHVQSLAPTIYNNVMLNLFRLENKQPKWFCNSFHLQDIAEYQVSITCHNVTNRLYCSKHTINYAISKCSRLPVFSCRLNKPDKWNDQTQDANAKIKNFCTQWRTHDSARGGRGQPGVWGRSCQQIFADFT